MRTAFIDTLCELAAQDEHIWLLTGDLGYSVLERFATRFPDRYVNVGVAEQNMIGVAAGLARCGKMPWVPCPAEHDGSGARRPCRNPAGDGSDR
jgi:transketolase C-terminal domain/subunit